MVLIINQLVAQGCVIENVSMYRSSLEDVFMKLTGKSINEEDPSDDTNYVGSDV